ncbi:biofilm regulation diguanylate cyclase SiaD [Novispirillum itersonii]|uniref:diguanylate cyclase n=1 Tax=Novispirillum itersonii TaxID=189 RepID=A0A7W9ZC34_NOVIT|nr:biofilm regulation diguanylate cyclase SiaD [Novispirillum itersonii]MBB6208733.1 diguanylate cyclase (GGDEF)-like protein [Novispirillum itersonii]
MTSAFPPPSSLESRISQLLADPVYDGHPLRQALEDLWETHRDLDRRLDRIARVSDAFQSMARERELGLQERMERDLRRLEKLARISDRYQSMMRDLNVALTEASTHDSLTRLPNRRLLTDRLKAEAERADRYDRSFTVVMIDIDHFKRINDACGHDVGDSVLIELAHAMGAELRDQDCAGRWGGEEFVLLLPETPLDAAVQVVERVRDRLNRVRVPYPHPTGSVTASAGLAEHIPGTPVTATLTRADTALLTAKRNGRDRIERAGADTPADLAVPFPSEA